MTRQAKYFVIAAVVVLAVAAGAFVYFTPVAAPVSDSNTIDQNPPAATGTPSVSTTTEPSGITLLQVAAHAGISSCWTIVRGSVYDLTEWISKHPGGPEKILQLCGKDGTDKFVNKHGGSEKQEDTLATFKIGVLAQ